MKNNPFQLIDPYLWMLQKLVTIYNVLKINSNFVDNNLIENKLQNYSFFSKLSIIYMIYCNDDHVPINLQSF